jgi:cell division initiation protein
MLKSDEQTQRSEAAGVPALTGEGGRRLPSADRNLTVTPLDLRQAKFNGAMRGFDRAEVTAFLLEAADGYEQAMRENDRLRQEVARLDSSLTQYRDLESSIKSTLLTAQQTADRVCESAQKTADDLREHATQEAARIVREAEGRAELLLQKTEARAEDVQRDIDALRMKRREAESQLESIIAAIQTTVAFVREQEHRDHPRTAVPALQVVKR